MDCLKLVVAMILFWLLWMDFLKWCINFISCSKTTDTSRIAKLFFKEVFRLHGLPSIIVSHHVVKFVSYFWKTLWKLFGTTLKYSSAFHHQTDGQTKVVNHSLGDMFRSLVGEKLGNWDFILPTAEFVYNNFVNRSIGKSPFEIVTGNSPHQPIDLVPLLTDYGFSKSAQNFVEHTRTLHEEIL